MIPAYIINLKRNVDRRNRLLEQIKLKNLETVLDIHWVDAVDGKLLHENDSLKFAVNTAWYEPIHKKPLTCGEIGCGMSHWNIWKIIATSHQSAIIFEDDIIFTDSFVSDITGCISRLIPDTDLAYIYRKALDSSAEKIINDEWTVAKKSYWTCAYVVTQAGAKKLLETAYADSLIPVDEFLSVVYDLEYRLAEKDRCNVTYNYPQTFNAYATRNNSLCYLNDDFSFNTSDTFHSPSYTVIDTSLLAVTIMSANNSALTRWKYSCETFGIPYKILTINNYDGNPFSILTDIVTDTAAEYILFTDYNFTFMLGNPTEIIAAYIKVTGSKLLFPSADKTRFIGRVSILRDLIQNKVKIEDVCQFDTKCVLFQNAIRPSKSKKVKRSKHFVQIDCAVLYNTKTGTEPKILYCDKNNQVYFNSLENYTLYGQKQKYGFRFDNIIKTNFPIIDVYAFMIDGISSTLSEQFNIVDYPADRIRIHIFGEKKYNQSKYEIIYLDTNTPYAHIINSMSDADYVWICYENYIIQKPNILKDLISSNRDIVCPLFKKDGFLLTNFWGKLNKKGFYSRSADYIDIVNQKIKALWNVPFVTGNILFKSDVLVRNPDIFTRNPDVDMDMRICQNLRDHNELMYLLNLEIYGVIEEPDTNTVVTFSDKTQWPPKKYLHPKFYDFVYGNNTWGDPRNPSSLSNNLFTEIAADVWHFPIFTEEFCDKLVAEANKFGIWSPGNDTEYDPRLQGKHENYPTQDIHLNQIGLGEFWEKIIVGTFFSDVMSHLYKYQSKGYNIAFIVRYKFGEQTKLSPHHDSSAYTTNIALNTAGVDYEGGGCKFIYKNFTITDNEKGYAILHPGKISHYHEGLPITKGTRYILISFNE